MMMTFPKKSDFNNLIVEIFNEKYLVNFCNKPLSFEEKWIVANFETFR